MHLPIFIRVDSLAPWQSYDGHNLKEIMTLGHFHQRFFVCNSNLMEISPCCNSIVGHQIAAHFAHAKTAQLSRHAQNFVAITVV